jgi:hypothetical protein
MTSNNATAMRPHAFTLSGDDATVSNPLFEGSATGWSSNALYGGTQRRKESVFVLGFEGPADIGDREETKVRRPWLIFFSGKVFDFSPHVDGI